MTGHRLNTKGFGLPTTVMLIAVVTALSFFGVALAIQEQRTHTRSAHRVFAFYAAETGLYRALENWNRPPVAEPGGAWVVTEGTLDGGARYRVTGTLLDDARTVQPLFMLRSEGRYGPRVMRHTGLLLATVPFGHPIKGALRTIGQVRVAGQAEVSGYDSIPAAWSEDCPSDLTDAAGVIMTDTTRMTRSGAATITGSPRVDEDTTLTGYFDFGPLSYDELAAMADIPLGGGTSVSGTDPAPRYDGDTCDTTHPFNWGDPQNPDAACGDWFPVIHVSGNLRAEGSGTGQGILLTDGDLTVCGGFAFYGPVVVKGSVKSCGSGFKLFGGVVAGESDLNPSGGGMVVGSSRVQYSACTVQRAISRSRASRPQPLQGRAWFQTR